jgi:flagellar biosynthesis anti-sigma factor FlgM
MRIGLNTSDPQATSTEKTNKSGGNSSSNSAAKVQSQPAGDTLTLSALSSKAMESPEIRQQQVDALRQSVSSGQYQPDSNESAEAMLSY